MKDKRYVTFRDPSDENDGMLVHCVCDRISISIAKSERQLVVFLWFEGGFPLIKEHELMQLCNLKNWGYQATDHGRFITIPTNWIKEFHGTDYPAFFPVYYEKDQNNEHFGL